MPTWEQDKIVTVRLCERIVVAPEGHLRIAQRFSFSVGLPRAERSSPEGTAESPGADVVFGRPFRDLLVWGARTQR
ncbi:MAG: hypothetical protein ACREP9_09365 [Candidatus Dormibacteraceae bacterium]